MDGWHTRSLGSRGWGDMREWTRGAGGATGAVSRFVRGRNQGGGVHAAAAAATSSGPAAASSPACSSPACEHRDVEVE